MTLQARTQALLDLVESDRAQRRDALLSQASERARALLEAANAQARERVREVFAEERARLARELDAARARLQTHRRLSAQRRAVMRLEEAWARLPHRLAARWREPAARAAWVEHVLEGARASLPPGAWRVAHAPDWPDAERDAAASRLAAALGGVPEWVPDPSIRAGLRVSVSGNVVDGTLDGLLADRDEVGARLLSHLGELA